MLFDTYTFIVFFAVVFALLQALAEPRQKKVMLLGASYLFYGAWNPPFVLLLVSSTVVDWFVAKKVESTSGPCRRFFLLVSLCSNLGMLAYFKYASLISESLASVLNNVGYMVSAPSLDIVLPVGISFYTFQTLSYTIDIYRNETKSWKSFLDFALFVSFFPQLVAGPIVRAVDFHEQVKVVHKASRSEFLSGLTLAIVGLFQKVVVADALLARHADRVYNAAERASVVDAWTGTLAFAGQIYCDFAGYSTCAIGIALMLGFRLNRNFHSPYAAIGFSDFWRRWHISLSTWLRDYLYISLGGNRSGKFQRYRNLMITMLLGGLWHGASWRFLVWGALHGIFLVLEQVVRHVWGPRETGLLVTILGWVVTLLGVLLTWVFFRANSFSDAWALLGAMAGQANSIGPSVLSPRHILVVVAVMVVLLAVQVRLRNITFEDWFASASPTKRSLLIAAMLLLVFLSPGGERAFIYFQF